MSRMCTVFVTWQILVIIQLIIMHPLFQVNIFDRNSLRNITISVYWKSYSYRYQRGKHVAHTLESEYVFFLDCCYFMVHCYFKNDFLSQVILTVTLLATCTLILFYYRTCTCYGTYCDYECVYLLGILYCQSTVLGGSIFTLVDWRTLDLP